MITFRESDMSRIVASVQFTPVPYKGIMLDGAEASLTLGVAGGTTSINLHIVGLQATTGKPISVPVKDRLIKSAYGDGRNDLSALAQDMKQKASARVILKNEIEDLLGVDDFTNGYMRARYAFPKPQVDAYKARPSALSGGKVSLYASVELDEYKEGDAPFRVGIMIYQQGKLLGCKPTNVEKFGKEYRGLDLPKGHLSESEIPVDGAIRECAEETGLVFSRSELFDEFHSTMDGDPIWLWWASVQGVSLDDLWCDSTFVDEATGKELPEHSGYEWVELPRDIGKFQPRLQELVLAAHDSHALDDPAIGATPAEYPDYVGAVK
jgi:8-oxo-dGTP pyrophosphatase MutT (NUDIX family)